MNCTVSVILDKTEWFVRSTESFFTAKYGETLTKATDYIESARSKPESHVVEFTIASKTIVSFSNSWFCLASLCPKQNRWWFDLY